MIPQISSVFLNLVTLFPINLTQEYPECEINYSAFADFFYFFAKFLRNVTVEFKDFVCQSLLIKEFRHGF